MKTNSFELRGIVGNPPDVRFTTNGKTVATFSVYTRERWTDGSGEQREKSQRHQITAWGAQAEFAERRLEKGSRVQIVGRIDQQAWGEGQQRQYKTVLVATEIALIGEAAEAAPAAEEPAPQAEEPDQESSADTAARPQPKRRRKPTA
jgi:single-strand DNA-binding protein